LDDGPGLLPFKLGKTKLTTHYHTFLQLINLDKIEKEIVTLKDDLQDYRDRLSNDTYSLYELQLTYLDNKTNIILDNLNRLKPGRTKRGLLDGLGSVIKSITGNLDYQDAINYNNAIKLLQENQNKISLEFNSRISLNNEWMKERDHIIRQLVTNQKIINSTFQLILDENAHNDNNLIKYGKFAQLLAIITDNANDLLDEIIRIENILAFTRSRTTHHSMLSVNVLKIMLNKLILVYGRDQLVDLELRDYYSIIRSGSFYINKQIVIIFRFPIVSSNNYELYKLSIAPNKFHQVLIPSYPYIATNGKEFLYVQEKCPKLRDQYLCEESSQLQIRNQTDCIQEVISRQTLDSTCSFTTVHLINEAMEKLDDRSYVISFPRQTKVRFICSTQIYNVLKGSFLVTIPAHCSLRTPEYTITNSNDVIQGQPIKIMKITYPEEIKTTAASHLNLSSIDLKSLHNIRDRIMIQPAMQLNNAPGTLYHTTIPFYVILSCVAILVLTILARRYNLWNCRYKLPDDNKKSYSIHQDEDPEHIGSPVPSLAINIVLKKNIFF
jgi:hypothetical protein